VRLGPGSRRIAAARKLVAIAEVFRRNPEDGFEPEPGQMPAVVHEFTRDQLALALGESAGAADWLLTVAWHLATRLAGTLEALADGIITRGKAELIVRLTQHLSDDEAGGGGEGAGPGRAADPGGLRSALARAVMEVAPEKAQAAAGDRGEVRPGGAVGRGLRQRRTPSGTAARGPNPRLTGNAPARPAAGRGRVFLHPGQPGRAARRVRHLAAAHPRRRADLIVAIDTLDTRHCEHRYEARGHDPGSSCGICPRSGTPPAPARCAGDPPADLRLRTQHPVRGGRPHLLV
jgi:hypothetical protein